MRVPSLTAATSRLDMSRPACPSDLRNILTKHSRDDTTRTGHPANAVPAIGSSDAAVHQTFIESEANPKLELPRERVNAQMVIHQGAAVAEWHRIPQYREQERAFQMEFLQPTLTAQTRSPPHASAVSASLATGRAVSWQWLGIIALIAGGVLPLLLPYFRDLGQRALYAHYPLLIVASILLGLSRLNELRPQHVRPAARWWLPAALLAGAAGLLVIGTVTYVRWLAAPTTIAAIAAIAGLIGGRDLLRAICPALVLLLTIVPPPGRAETNLTTQLQTLSVVTSSRLLDILHVDNVRTGNVLSIAGHRLLIEEACSGINSIVAVTAFTLFAGFWFRRPIWRIVALLPFALLFVVGLNIVRIMAGALLLNAGGINLFDGALHEWVGMILFAAGIGLVLSADRAIGLLLPERPSTVPSSRPSETSPANWTTPLRVGWIAAIAFVSIGGWTAYRLRDCWPAPRLRADASFRMPATVGEFVLQPPRIDGSDAETTNTTAKHVRRWVYRTTDGDAAEVAIAYPFTTWFHDPRICYSAAGWRTSPFTSIGEAGTGYTFEMSQLGGRHATVYFADFAEDGQPQTPLERPADQSNLSRRLWLTQYAAFYRPSCEVQVLSTGPRQMDDARRAKMQALFLSVRESLRQQVITNADGGR